MLPLPGYRMGPHPRRVSTVKSRPRPAVPPEPLAALEGGWAKLKPTAQGRDPLQRRPLFRVAAGHPWPPCPRARARLSENLESWSLFRNQGWLSTRLEAGGAHPPGFCAW